MERFITILLIGFFGLYGTMSAQAQQRYEVRSGVYLKIPIGVTSGPTQPKMSFGFQTNVYGYSNNRLAPDYGASKQNIRMTVMDLSFGHFGFDSFSLAGQKILLPGLGYTYQIKLSESGKYAVAAIGLLAVVGLVALLANNDDKRCETDFCCIPLGCN